MKTKIIYAINKASKERVVALRFNGATEIQVIEKTYSEKDECLLEYSEEEFKDLYESAFYKEISLIETLTGILNEKKKI